MTTTGGIVLAGGRSRRMGTSKALLDWHGRPLIAHVAAELRRALGEGAPIVVVHAPGQQLPALEQVLLVADPAEGRGPLQGLAAGLAALGEHSDAAVALATDQPWAAGVVPLLVAAARPGDDAVAFDGEPLGALYRPRVARIAQQRVEAGTDQSLRGLLAAIATRTLQPDAAVTAALRSLDTPEAYAAALRP